MTVRIGSPNKGPTVVAIDDQLENLILLQAIIEHRGYTFLGATSGAEGIGLAAQAAPRLILLDVQMPDMDGFETCRQLRGIWALKATPIAFLTACKTGADVQAGMKAGGDDFLMKPFDAEKLLARIEHWTSRKPIPA